MQVNKTNNVNFTGIYRLPLNDKNINELSEYVLPVYKFLKKEPVICFPGKNPYKIITDMLIDKVAELSGGSREWLKMNAENHKLKTDLIDDGVMHVVTTKKDVASLENFIKSEVTKKLTFMEKLKQKFKKPEPSNIREDLPFHLQFLQGVLNEIKKRNTAFDEFSHGNIIDVSEPKDLLIKMLMEK